MIESYEARTREEHPRNQKTKHRNNQQPQADTVQANHRLSPKDFEGHRKTDRQNQYIPEPRLRFRDKVQRGEQPTKTEAQQDPNPVAFPGRFRSDRQISQNGNRVQELRFGRAKSQRER